MTDQSFSYQKKCCYFGKHVINLFLRPSQVLEVKVCDLYLVLSSKTFMYLNFEEALLSNLYISVLLPVYSLLLVVGNFLRELLNRCISLSV